jgi:hypothetical protein
MHHILVPGLWILAGIILTLAFIFVTVWFEDWKTFRVKGRRTPEDWQKKWEIVPKEEVMAFANIANVDVHWNQSAGGYVITSKGEAPNREHILIIVGYFAGMDEWKKAVDVVRHYSL